MSESVPARKRFVLLVPADAEAKRDPVRRGPEGWTGDPKEHPEPESEVSIFFLEAERPRNLRPSSKDRCSNLQMFCATDFLILLSSLTSSICYKHGEPRRSEANFTKHSAIIICGCWVVVTRNLFILWLLTIVETNNIGHWKKERLKLPVIPVVDAIKLFLEEFLKI